MRGQKIFNEIVKNEGVNKPMRKGRSHSLIDKRNACLLARYYYYYGTIKNKVYEETLHLLLNEFFLSPSTIINIIMDHTEHLHELKQKAPTLYYFQNRWGYMKW